MYMTKNKLLSTLFFSFVYSLSRSIGVGGCISCWHSLVSALFTAGWLSINKSSLFTWAWVRLQDDVRDHNPKHQLPRVCSPAQPGGSDYSIILLDIILVELLKGTLILIIFSAIRTSAHVKPIASVGTVGFEKYPQQEVQMSN